MRALRTIAHAKINLTLDVVGKRPDGYHDLIMVMQEITLGDEVTVCLETGRDWAMETDSEQVPCDDSNLCIKAARLFLRAANIDCDGLTVRLCKRTPVCAGMGGGSADGAAVLRLLDDAYGHPLSEETLYALAEQVGSDVPFALFGGTALAREKGQVLSRLPRMPACDIVLCKPSFPVSTPALFRRVDTATISRRPDTNAFLAALERGDLQTLANHMVNVFEPIVSADHPELAEIRKTMLDAGALGAAMTGSGPTMFGLFREKHQAEVAYTLLKSRYPDTFLANPV